MGDKNFKFFHATTIQRRGCNILQRIKNGDGEWVEGQEEIEATVLTYFNEIYQQAEPNLNRDCINVIPRLVTNEMNDNLLLHVTNAEIRKAVFHMGALKAPGPDGLNGLFYQNHWDTIKHDICSVVSVFFEDGSLPAQVNETIVALVPKVSTASTYKLL